MTAAAAVLYAYCESCHGAHAVLPGASAGASWRSTSKSERATSLRVCALRWIAGRPMQQSFKLCASSFFVPRTLISCIWIARYHLMSNIHAQYLKRKKEFRIFIINIVVFLHKLLCPNEIAASLRERYISQTWESPCYKYTAEIVDRTKSWPLPNLGSSALMGIPCTIIFPNMYKRTRRCVFRARLKSSGAYFAVMALPPSQWGEGVELELRCRLSAP